MTTVSGFKDFKDLKLKDLTKKLTKKFGCGAGAVTKESFELQGLYRDALIKYLIEETGLGLTEESFKVDESLKNAKNKVKIN